MIGKVHLAISICFFAVRLRPGQRGGKRACPKRRDAGRFFPGMACNEEDEGYILERN
jgi:hypothetical protein